MAQKRYKVTVRIIKEVTRIQKASSQRIAEAKVKEKLRAIPLKATTSNMEVLYTESD